MGWFRRIFFSERPRATTGFSDFIRNASSAEKKKVYTEGLKKATARQNETVRKARVRLSEQRPPA